MIRVMVWHSNNNPMSSQGHAALAITRNTGPGLSEITLTSAGFRWNWFRAMQLELLRVTRGVLKLARVLTSL